MGKLYDTDVSDAAWTIVEPHLPPANRAAVPARPTRGR